LFKSVGL